MGLLLSLLIITLILIVPLKLAATWLGARKTGFSSCFMALILALLLQIGLDKSLPHLNDHMGLLISIPLSGVAYMLVLDTSFLKGIGIALVQAALLMILLSLFAGAVLIAA